jgi:tetratricopeptide (TPR) repeat protein
MKMSFQYLFFMTILTLWGWGIYANALQIDTFQYDDYATVIENPFIKEGATVQRIYRCFNTRFLPGLTFAGNYALGGLHPFGYRLFNLVVHIFNSWLVFQCVRQLLKTPRMKDHPVNGISGQFAFAVAMIFVSHPLQTEAVTFITQRYVSLAAFFYLLTIVLYLYARQRNSVKAYMGGILSGLAAMYCKEIAITLPLMLVLVEVYFWGNFQKERFKRGLLLVPYLCLLSVIPLNLLKTSDSTISSTRMVEIVQTKDAHNGQAEFVQEDMGRALSSYSRKAYALTQFNVLVTYLRLFIWPVKQNLDYDYPIVKGWGDGKTWGCALFLLALGAGAIRWERRWPLVSFGIFWFFLTLSVESSLIPIGHVIAEYRMYLAIVGLAMVLTYGFYAVLIHKEKIVTLAVITAVIFGIATYRRNTVWSSPVSLWQDTVRKSPHKARPHANLGILYTQLGYDDKAQEHFRSALIAQPDDAKIHTDFGFLLARGNRLQEAITHYEKAIELNPRYALSYYNLGAVYGVLRAHDQEVLHYQKALELRPDWPEVILSLGKAYHDLGNREKAREQIHRLKILGEELMAQELAQYTSYE